MAETNRTDNTSVPMPDNGDPISKRTPRLVEAIQVTANGGYLMLTFGGRASVELIHPKGCARILAVVQKELDTNPDFFGGKP